MTNSQVADTVVRWHRASARCIQWTVEGGDYFEATTYHCNGYATFHGPAEGRHYLTRQVTGYASSAWDAVDSKVSAYLRREFKARSVRKVAT